MVLYLIVRGFLDRRPVGSLVEVAVFLLSGGALLGVLPGRRGVSWQGHLFGAVGGVGAARVLTYRRRSDAEHHVLTGNKARTRPSSGS